MASRWSAQKEGTGDPTGACLDQNFCDSAPVCGNGYPAILPPLHERSPRVSRRRGSLWFGHAAPNRHACDRVWGVECKSSSAHLWRFAPPEISYKVFTTTEKHGKGQIYLCYNVVFVSWIRSNIVSTRVCLKFGRPPSTCFSHPGTTLRSTERNSAANGSRLEISN